MSATASRETVICSHCAWGGCDIYGIISADTVIDGKQALSVRLNSNFAFTAQLTIAFYQIIHGGYSSMTAEIHLAFRRKISEFNIRQVRVRTEYYLGYEAFMLLCYGKHFVLCQL